MKQYSQELRNKEIDYRYYIREHIANVSKAWAIIDAATEKYNLNRWGMDMDSNAHIIIDELIRKHDQSKFEQIEFIPYRARFYPVDGEEIDSKEFEKAWQHHKDNNLHHWQSMAAINYNHSLILEYTVEMICDWLAMAMKFGEGHRDYYNKSKNSIKLEKWQHELIEEIYTALDMWIEEGNKIQ